MQKWTAFLFAGVFALAVAVVVSMGGRRPAGPLKPAADGGVDAPHELVLDAGAPDPVADLDADVPTDPTGLPSPDAGGTLLLNGEAPPPLAGEAPKSVVFGVILVTYKGAQGAASGARTREAALELAKQLAAEAKTDFKAAVGKGDKGSTENAGRLPRGILEPAPEYVLFSLPKGGVSDPVDTPRGYWIAQRIE